MAGSGGQQLTLTCACVCRWLPTPRRRRRSWTFSWSMLGLPGPLPTQQTALQQIPRKPRAKLPQLLHRTAPRAGRAAHLPASPCCCGPPCRCCRPAQDSGFRELASAPAQDGPRSWARCASASISLLLQPLLRAPALLAIEVLRVPSLARLAGTAGCEPARRELLLQLAAQPRVTSNSQTVAGPAFLCWPPCHQQLPWCWCIGAPASSWPASGLCTQLAAAAPAVPCTLLQAKYLAAAGDVHILLRAPCARTPGRAAP